MQEESPSKQFTSPLWTFFQAKNRYTRIKRIYFIEIFSQRRKKYSNICQKIKQKQKWFYFFCQSFICEYVYCLLVMLSKAKIHKIVIKRISYVLKYNYHLNGFLSFNLLIWIWFDLKHKKDLKGWLIMLGIQTVYVKIMDRHDQFLLK